MERLRSRSALATHAAQRRAMKTGAEQPREEDAAFRDGMADCRPFLV